MLIAGTCPDIFVPRQYPAAPKSAPKPGLLAHISGIALTVHAVLIDGFTVAPRTRNDHGKHLTVGRVTCYGHGLLKRPSTNFPPKFAEYRSLEGPCLVLRTKALSLFATTVPPEIFP